MPNYYVSASRGSDSTGAGTATNPWATIGKAIDGGVSPGPAITLPPSGTTRVIVEPGVYREGLTLRLSPSTTAPLVITGDPDGSLFAAGGAADSKTGVVEWLAWTDDLTAMNASALVVSGKSNVTIEKFTIEGGSRNNSPYPGSAIDLPGATNITIRDCVLVGCHDAALDASVLRATATAGTTLNLLLERSEVVCGGDTTNGLRVLAPEHSSDYDVGVAVLNCLFRNGRDQIRLEKSGGTGGKVARGMRVAGCTFLGDSTSASVRADKWTGAAASPLIVVRLCVFAHNRRSVSGEDASYIDEDYNFFTGGAPRWNTNAGANSKIGLPRLNFSADRPAGGRPRPSAEPLAGSPLLAFGARPADLAVDMLGRPRPDPCAAGCLERAAPVGGGTAPTYIFQTEG